LLKRFHGIRQLTASQNRRPARLWLVRHAQSAGNIARDAALAAGLPRIDLKSRDADVPLSATGTDQAVALGEWFSGAADRPDVVLASPYRRARQTAQAVAEHAGLDPGQLRLDERLREKEFGIIDGLTRLGIEQHYPDLAASRTLTGKFYHRPPGGESWCDVILRLRSVLATLALEFSGKNVLIVSHQVVVLCTRYVLENMTEEQILEIDRKGDVMNCAVTEYADEDGCLRLKRYNWIPPTLARQAKVTAEPKHA
jgi:broad specificity phosphatase PhoE